MQHTFLSAQHSSVIHFSYYYYSPSHIITLLYCSRSLFPTILLMAQMHRSSVIPAGMICPISNLWRLIQEMNF